MWTSFNMSVIHFYSQLPMGGKVLHSAHHFNFQLLVGGESSTLHMSFQLSTAKGGGWYPPHFTSSESHIIWACDPPHFTCIQSHINGGGLGSSTLHIQSKTHCLGGGVWYPPHFTSSQSHIVWRDGAYPPHLTNQVECVSALKPNWLSSLYASTA